MVVRAPLPRVPRVRHRRHLPRPRPREQRRRNNRSSSRSRSSSNCRRCRRPLLRRRPPCQRPRKIICRPPPRPAVPACPRRSRPPRRPQELPRDRRLLVPRQRRRRPVAAAAAAAAVVPAVATASPRRNRPRIATSVWVTRGKTRRPADPRSWCLAAIVAAQVSQRKRSSASIPGGRITIEIR